MTSSCDRVDGRECLRRLLAEADTELMTTQHALLKLPLPLYLKYVAYQAPGEPMPVSSLSHCSRCSHCSKSTGSDSKHTENDYLDPIYAMYADEHPKPDRRTGAGDSKTYSSNMTPTPLVIKKKNSTSTDSRTLEVEDDFSFFSAQDIINHGGGDQKSESACSSGFHLGAGAGTGVKAGGGGRAENIFQKYSHRHQEDTARRNSLQIVAAAEVLAARHFDAAEASDHCKIQRRDQGLGGTNRRLPSPDPSALGQRWFGKPVRCPLSLQMLVVFI